MLIMHIGFLACFHAISLERSRFSKIASLRALVALKMLEIYSKQRDDCRHNNYLTIIISIVSLGREPMEQSVLHKQL